MSERDRPSVYLHFEFGVAWPRNASRNRQITYMSKSSRDKANQFPRQLPPPNTNFLANPATFHFPTHQAPTVQPYSGPQVQQYHQQQAITYYNHGTLNATTRHGNLIPQQDSSRQHNALTQPQVQVASHHHPPQQQQQHHQPYQQHYLQPPTQQHHQSQQTHAQGEQAQRQSRSQSRSSHERGTSAPPPFNSSPWDASANASASAGPRNTTSSRNVPTSKALPATPNQFRLGEDGMPWSSWTFPLGYDDYYENGEDQSDAQSLQENVQATWGPEYPPESSRQVDADDRNRGRTQEMQSLATALMTVDNGFEDQWWYQGSRLVNVTGTVLVPTPLPITGDGIVGVVDVLPEREAGEILPRSASLHQSSTSFNPTSPRSSVVDIVSPISDYPSPMSSYGGLRRSLTTRSDELHM